MRSVCGLFPVPCGCFVFMTKLTLEVHCVLRAAVVKVVLPSSPSHSARPLGSRGRGCWKGNSWHRHAFFTEHVGVLSRGRRAVSASLVQALEGSTRHRLAFPSYALSTSLKWTVWTDPAHSGQSAFCTSSGQKLPQSSSGSTHPSASEMRSLWFPCASSAPSLPTTY